MKRTNAAILLAGSMFALPSVAEYSAEEAAADTGFYVGASAGYSNIFSGTSDKSGVNIDEDHDGYKIAVGYQFHRHLALELSGTKFGDASLTGNAGDTFSNDDYHVTLLYDNTHVEFEQKSLALAGIISLPLSDSIRPYGKLGLHYWERKEVVTSSGFNGTLDYDGTDAIWGFGVEFDLTENLFMRVEYENYDYDGFDSDFTTAGLFFSF